MYCHKAVAYQVKFHCLSPRDYMASHWLCLLSPSIQFSPAPHLPNYLDLFYPITGPKQLFINQWYSQLTEGNPTSVPWHLLLIHEPRTAGRTTILGAPKHVTHETVPLMSWSHVVWSSADTWNPLKGLANILLGRRWLLTNTFYSSGRVWWIFPSKLKEAIILLVCLI